MIVGLIELQDLIRAGATKKQLLEQVNKIEFQNFGGWCLEDIRELPFADPELTDAQARKIARRAEKNFDTEVGINAYTIERAYIESKI